MPTKRWIVYIDGTGNDASSRTNIYRMFEATVKKAEVGGVWQDAKYWPGVGVKPWEKLRGGAFGRYLSKQILEAYTWLAEHHRDHDEIHILGFSRGAFAAMGLVGFLAWRGLPKKQDSPKRLNGLSERHFKLYHQSTRKSQESREPGSRSWEELNSLSKEERSGLSTLDQEVVEQFRPVGIKFVGLFDTVRAAGLEVFRWIGNRMPSEVPEALKVATRGTLALRYTRHLPSNVERAYHALAIDEHRAVFHPRVWIVPKQRANSPQAVEQRWFIGAHANVGGGYDHDSLAVIPGYWMQEKAKASGIRFVTGKEHRNPSPSSEDCLTHNQGCKDCLVRDSYREWLKGIYSRLSWRRYQRPIYAYVEQQQGLEYERQTVDQTVAERYAQDPCYRPKNFEKWLDGCMIGRIEKLRDSLGNDLIDRCFEKLRASRMRTDEPPCS
ncbi:MAG: DUF2235 domain-containing protein [Nitrospiraceae bacterium]